MLLMPLLACLSPGIYGWLLPFFRFFSIIFLFLLVFFNIVTIDSTVLILLLRMEILLLKVLLHGFSFCPRSF
jgi:hypothetical protein